MELDSARELKTQLTAQVLTPLSAMPPVTARAARDREAPINVAAQSLSTVEPVQRTIALGIAKKGKNNYKLAVRLQRRALQDHAYLERVNKAARGEVDVRYIGRITKRAIPWYQQRCRPLRPGCSIGHFKITAGTLGCFVNDPDGALYVLSNNHVLANENRAKKGDAILQPGAFDGGSDPADRVASLTRFVRLKASATNLVDCAIALVDDGIGHDLSVRGIGKIAGLFGDQIQDGIRVQKLGRTTGLTHGRISAFEVDNVIVNYDMGNIKFDDQIEIEGVDDSLFSDGGDSGSLILTDDRKGIALLFAGSDQGGPSGHGLTYANPLGTVLKRMRVSLA